MSAWREAAAECGSDALWWYDYGAWHVRHSYPAPILPRTNTNPYLAGYYEAKAKKVALAAVDAKPPASTRLDVALAALKMAERTWRNFLSLPACPVCRHSASDFDCNHWGSVRRVTVKRAIKHAPDCELARALRWEDSP